MRGAVVGRARRAYTAGQRYAVHRLVPRRVWQTRDELRGITNADAGYIREAGKKPVVGSAAEAEACAPGIEGKARQHDAPGRARCAQRIHRDAQGVPIRGRQARQSMPGPAPVDLHGQAGDGATPVQPAEQRVQVGFVGQGQVKADRQAGTRRNPAAQHLDEAPIPTRTQCPRQRRAALSHQGPHAGLG
jgi:hypothetical protein